MRHHLQEAGFLDSPFSADGDLLPQQRSGPVVARRRCAIGIETSNRSNVARLARGSAWPNSDEFVPDSLLAKACLIERLAVDEARACLRTTAEFIGSPL